MKYLQFISRGNNTEPLLLLPCVRSTSQYCSLRHSLKWKILFITSSNTYWNKLFRKLYFYNPALTSFGTFESKSIKDLPKAPNKNCCQNYLIQFPIYIILSHSIFKMLDTLGEFSGRISCWWFNCNWRISCLLLLWEVWLLKNFPAERLLSSLSDAQTGLSVSKIRQLELQSYFPILGIHLRCLRMPSH